MSDGSDIDKALKMLSIFKRVKISFLLFADNYFL